MRKKGTHAPAPLPDWARKPKAPAMDPRALEAIVRRRRQMLVHSYIYYHANESIITDETWTKWAKQLARLHEKYGYRVGFYDDAFADWDGSSGFHLPVDLSIINTARRLLADHHERMEIIG